MSANRFILEVLTPVCGLVNTVFFGHAAYTERFDWAAYFLILACLQAWLYTNRPAR